MSISTATRDTRYIILDKVHMEDEPEYCKETLVINDSWMNDMMRPSLFNS